MTSRSNVWFFSGLLCSRLGVGLHYILAFCCPVSSNITCIAQHVYPRPLIHKCCTYYSMILFVLYSTILCVYYVFILGWLLGTLSPESKARLHPYYIWHFINSDNRHSIHTHVSYSSFIINARYYSRQILKNNFFLINRLILVITDGPIDVNIHLYIYLYICIHELVGPMSPTAV